MGLNFHETLMGKKFIEGTIPTLVSAVENLTKQVKRLADATERIEDSDKNACNEVAVFFGEAGWVYIRTHADNLADALRELEKKGVNFDNVDKTHIRIELRDTEGTVLS